MWNRQHLTAVPFARESANNEVNIGGLWTMELSRGSPALVDEFFDRAPDGLVVVDEMGRIQCVNARVETLFRIPREGLLGQPRLRRRSRVCSGRYRWQADLAVRMVAHLARRRPGIDT
jgi:PAS domain-containing protein